MTPPFQAFERIPRLHRDIVITEKLDGTNAVVHIDDSGTVVTAGSRSRWITPDNDNYGFARWVEENKQELLKLGPGYHYGEWWGAGIQRRYGLKEKRWSLFNTARWSDPAVRPACCHVVPLLYDGPLLGLGDPVKDCLASLWCSGSVAAPGFMQPEGIVVFHKASNHLYKVTLPDDGHKKAKGAPT